MQNIGTYLAKEGWKKDVEETIKDVTKIADPLLTMAVPGLLYHKTRKRINEANRDKKLITYNAIMDAATSLGTWSPVLFMDGSVTGAAIFFGSSMLRYQAYLLYKHGER